MLNPRLKDFLQKSCIWPQKLVSLQLREYENNNDKLLLVYKTSCFVLLRIVFSMVRSYLFQNKTTCFVAV